MATPYIEGHIPAVNDFGLNTQKNITMDGSNNFDGSGSTGTFKTPTGVTTLGGSTTNVSGNLVMAAGKTITGGVVNVITAAATLTAAQSGSLCIMPDLTGTLYTLPAATVGLTFNFFVSVTNTSGAHKVITPASVFLVGAISYGIVDTTPGANPGPKFTGADGSTIRSISMNGSTTGGVIGTAFTVTCISSTQWAIYGLVIASGTISTPFATS